jgi:hypothetical protein
MDHMSGQWGPLGRPAMPKHIPDDEPLLDRLDRIYHEGGSPGRPATPEHNPDGDILLDQGGSPGRPATPEHNPDGDILLDQGGSPGRPATPEHNPDDGLKQGIKVLKDFAFAAFENLFLLNKRVQASISLTDDLRNRLALVHPTSLEGSGTVNSCLHATCRWW